MSWRQMTFTQRYVLAIAASALMTATTGAVICVTRWGLDGALSVVILSCTVLAVMSMWLLMDNRASKYDHAFLLGYRLREMDDAAHPPRLHLVDKTS
jgi:hypothetical protein